MHPQSVIHSLVEYVDGSVLAQLGNPDMRTPIAQALAYPERIDAGVPRLDLAALGALVVRGARPRALPVPARSPTTRCDAGGTRAVALNAANEVAVAAFLAGRARFTGHRGGLRGDARRGCRRARVGDARRRARRRRARRAALARALRLAARRAFAVQSRHDRRRLQGRRRSSSRSACSSCSTSSATTASRAWCGVKVLRFSVGFGRVARGRAASAATRPSGRSRRSRSAAT